MPRATLQGGPTCLGLAPAQTGTHALPLASNLGLLEANVHKVHGPVGRTPVAWQVRVAQAAEPGHEQGGRAGVQGAAGRQHHCLHAQWWGAGAQAGSPGARPLRPGCAPPSAVAHPSVPPLRLPAHTKQRLALTCAPPTPPQPTVSTISHMAARGWCSEAMTVWPAGARAMARRCPITPKADAESRPVVGSSRSSSCGCGRQPTATARRLRSPPLSPRSCGVAGTAQAQGVCLPGVCLRPLRPPRCSKASCARALACAGRPWDSWQRACMHELLTCRPPGSGPPTCKQRSSAHAGAHVAGGLPPRTAPLVLPWHRAAPLPPPPPLLPALPAQRPPTSVCCCAVSPMEASAARTRLPRSPLAPAA